MLAPWCFGGSTRPGGEDRPAVLALLSLSLSPGIGGCERETGSAAPHRSASEGVTPFETRVTRGVLCPLSLAERRSHRRLGFRSQPPPVVTGDRGAGDAAEVIVEAVVDATAAEIVDSSLSVVRDNRLSAVDSAAAANGIPAPSSTPIAGDKPAVSSPLSPSEIATDIASADDDDDLRRDGRVPSALRSPPAGGDESGPTPPITADFPCTRASRLRENRSSRRGTGSAGHRWVSGTVQSLVSGDPPLWVGHLVADFSGAFWASD